MPLGRSDVRFVSRRLIFTWLAADVEAAPRCGLVASSSTFREAMACSWVAFSSTLPRTSSYGCYLCAQKTDTNNINCGVKVGEKEKEDERVQCARPYSHDYAYDLQLRTRKMAAFRATAAACGTNGRKRKRINQRQRLRTRRCEQGVSGVR